MKNQIQTITFTSTGEKTKNLRNNCFMFTGLLSSFTAFIHIILFHKVVFSQKITTKLIIIHTKIIPSPNIQKGRDTSIIARFIIISNK